MNCNMQIPMEDIVGANSPVQKALKIMKKIAVDNPVPLAGEAAHSPASLIYVHLISLMDSAGLLNVMGHHSASITLLRAIEDATDCFAAVSLDTEAASLWQEGKLKSSEAAKKWTASGKIQIENIAIADYRKNLRTMLNNYSHCTPAQTHWNLFKENIGNNKCTLKLNTLPLVINSNGYAIDRYLCAHLLELITIVLVAYQKYFEDKGKIQRDLTQFCDEIQNVIVDFLQLTETENIDIFLPPELLGINETE